MKNTIPVKRLFRVLGFSKEPFGDVLTDETIEAALAKTIGAEVIDLRTEEVIYRFNKQKWQWEIASKADQTR